MFAFGGQRPLSIQLLNVPDLHGTYRVEMNDRTPSNVARFRIRLQFIWYESELWFCSVENVLKPRLATQGL